MAVCKDLTFAEVSEDLDCFYVALEEILSAKAGRDDDLKCLYDFAVGGVGLPVGDLIPQAGIFWTLSLFAEDMGGSLRKSKFSQVSKLLNLYQARVDLDGDNGCAESPADTLTVQQVALLGCLDERSVRNAISNGDIQTVRDGSATAIPNQEARRWLLGRRGFKATKWPDETVIPLEWAKTFPELTLALVERRKELSGSENISDLVAWCDKSQVSTGDIEVLESGEFPWPLSKCHDLALTYEVPEMLMTHAIMRVFFPEQYQLMSR
ncbi:MAG: hypothetical protein V7739_09060 [Motiliproteus sp.]